MQLVLDTNGLTVKVRNKSFWVIGKKLSRQISPYRVSSIAVTADCLLSSSAVRLAAKHGIPIFWMQATGRVAARSWSPGYGGHPSLLREQVHWGESAAATIWITELLAEKVAHQVQNLGWLINRKPGVKDQMQQTIGRLPELLKSVESVPEYPAAEVRDQIMGIEGSLSREYWRTVATAFDPPWSFAARSRRPAQDPFNAALNYLYGMTYGIVENAIFAAGISPYLGVLHTDGYRRPALSFDLIEPFRPWIDRLLLRLILRSELPMDAFKKKKNGVWISAPGKRILIPAFYEWMEGKATYHQLIRSRRNHIYLRAGAMKRILEENRKVD